MSLNHPALLTVYIFVSKKNSWGGVERNYTKFRTKWYYCDNKGTRG